MVVVYVSDHSVTVSVHVGWVLTSFTFPVEAHLMVVSDGHIIDCSKSTNIIMPYTNVHQTNQAYSTSTEMLASSMLLCTISEESATIPTRGSGATMGSIGCSSGWGCSDMRRSYKTDLASLASDAGSSFSPRSTQLHTLACGDAESDEWGYFVDNKH